MRIYNGMFAAATAPLSLPSLATGPGAAASWAAGVSFATTGRYVARLIEINVFAMLLALIALPAPTRAQTITISSVTATPATVQPGQTVVFTTTMTANQNASNYIVDFVLSPASTSTKITQKAFGVTFQAGVPLTEVYSWTVPAGTSPGDYWLTASVSTPKWKRLAWNRTDLTITAASVAAAPTNSQPPVVSGTAQVGQVLASTTGTWTGATSFAYQWAGNGASIAGATAASYTPVSSDAGHTLTATVTATGSSGATASATSAPTVPIVAASSQPGGSVSFVALHTYYISPTGSDSNSGTSPSSPWASTNHSGIVCGDVIIAATGAYNSANFDSYNAGSSVWGTVASCPSTSGGIDGTGGVYTATLLCATAFGCTINATTADGINIDKSNWAVEGFVAYNASVECFGAIPLTSSYTINYVAFINDIGHDCGLAALYDGGYHAATNGVDEFAFVGDIAFNGAQSSMECGSGLSINTPSNVDALAGTHVFASQNFSYGNIDGVCGPNSNFAGGFTTAAGNYSAGASSITVASVSGWGAHWPIAALYNWGMPTPAIPIGTLVSSVSGTTVGLDHALVSPGVSSGQNLAIGTTTDGQGLIFDSWAANGYTGQTAVENNVFWGNGSAGFTMFCGGTCATALKVYIANNTIYGNDHDYKRDGPGSGMYINDATGIGTFSITNNLVQADVIKPLGSTTYSAWNGTTGVGAVGTGQPVIAAQLGQPGYTVSGNYFKSAAGASCPVYAACDSGNNIGEYNGANYASGNTLGAAPGFASPTSLPTTAPNCTGHATTVDCMNAGYNVYANITPSTAPTSKGYQPPSTTCTPDALYPTWLKGIVYLQWSGSALTENAGLVNKPCGL